MFSHIMFGIFDKIKISVLKGLCSNGMELINNKIIGQIGLAKNLFTFTNALVSLRMNFYLSPSSISTKANIKNIISP